MAAVTHTVYPGDAAVEDGRLAIAGCDAVALAREFGTPAYVVAEADLRARAREFRAALAAHHDGPGEVLYACKAFPCLAVLRVFAEEGLGCQTASGGELHMALRAGFEPARIWMHGNARSDGELAEAVRARLGGIVIDSFDDLERLDRLVPDGERRRVVIRVTPEVHTDTHAKIATGHEDSKFGFALESAPAAIARAQSSPRLELVGLHMHIGSQLFDTGPIRAAVAALARLGDFGLYDLGGGLGAPYTAADRPLGAEDYVRGQAEPLRDLVGPGRSLVIEPGRGLVANACVTLYTVQTVKHGPTRTWVAVDGGMSDNLRPMLYGAPYEAAIADRMDADGTHCTVVGKHCESGDEIVRDVLLPDPRPGDVLVTPVTGAYGHALANNYNSIPRPPVLICAGGEARVAVRRETYDDLLRRDA